MAKRIEFSQTGGPDVLRYVDYDPGEPGPNQVRIRHHAVGLNFVDIYARTGLYPVAALPSGLGSEGAGVIEAVGSEVKNLAVGERVAYGQSPLGAYSDVRVMPVANVVKLPDSISFEQAAAVMLKGLTVWYLLRRTYRVKAGEIVLFHAAAGGVGSIACQWAKALDVKLIGVVGSAEKAALAKQLGAWATIDRSRESITDRVRELTNGEKCPVVYDSVGKSTFETSLDCLSPLGLLVSFGNSSGAVTGVNLGVLAQKGSLYVTRPTLGTYIAKREWLEEAVGELFDLVASGKIKVDVERKFPLADAGKAQAEVEAGRTTGSTILIP